MSDFGWTSAEWHATPEPGRRHLPPDRIFKAWSRRKQAKIRREVEEENALCAELKVRAEPEDVFSDESSSGLGEKPYTNLQNDIMEALAEAAVPPARRVEGHCRTVLPREDEAWGFDSPSLGPKAEEWEGRMANARLVLVGGGSFRPSRCGLEGEPGHRHVRLCAGPRVVVRQGARLPRGAAFAPGPWVPPRPGPDLPSAGLAPPRPETRCQACGYPPGRHNPTHRSEA